MEDQNIGKYCNYNQCHKKEYFSFQCTICNQHFCADHRNICGCLDNKLQNQTIQNSNQFQKNICSYYRRNNDTGII